MHWNPRIMRNALTILFFLSLLSPVCVAADASTLSVNDTCSLLPFWTSPVVGKVISPFGSRGGRSHTGADVKLRKGDTILAACKGVVTMAQTYYAYGKLITISHGSGIETYYSHLSKILINKGDSVACGQVIGLGGRSGNATTDHLHFEIRKDKKALNPEKYIQFNSGLVLKSPVNNQEVAKIPLLADNQKNASKITISAKTNKLGTPYELVVSAGSPSVAATSPNDSAEKSAITSGEIPSSVVVQKGDTLYSLAKRYNTTVEDLLAINELNGNLLKIGQVLKLKK